MNFILRQTGPPGARLQISLPVDQVVRIGRNLHSTDPNFVSLDSEQITSGQIAPEQIASEHARIEVLSNAESETTESELQCWVTDLGGEYGTQVNGTRIESFNKIEIKENDEIIFGFDYIFILEKERQNTSRPIGDYGQITSVPMDERLPVNLSVAERYLPDTYTAPEQPYDGQIPPGLARKSRKLLNFLPEIYRTSDVNHHYFPHQDFRKPAETSIDAVDRSFLLGSGADFTSRFLGLVESVLLPIEWTLNSFDLFLDQETAPKEFLIWLEQWFLVLSDDSWSDLQRRTFIAEADWLFERRGTKKALSRILEIYTNIEPKITEPYEIEQNGTTLPTEDNNETARSPYKFYVEVGSDQNTQLVQSVVQKIIEAFKPAHTTYDLKMPAKADGN